MRFGIGFFSCQRPPWDLRPFADLYGDVLDHARRAEAAGLDSFWVAEHHFAEDGYMSSVLPVSAAIASVTERIAVGCEVAASFIHPLRLAEDAITVDLISRGRLLLGVAQSYRDPEFAAFEVPRDGEAQRLETTLALLRQAFAGGPVRLPSGREVRLLPPFRPGGPPIVLGFHGVPAVEADRAARLADLYRTDPSLDLDEVERLVAIFDAGRGDRPSGDLLIFCYGFIADGDAWAPMAAGFTHLRQTYDVWAGRQPAEVHRDDHRLLLGGVDEVAAALQDYRRRFGDRLHVVFRLDYPGMAPEPVAGAIERYGQVAARLRGGA